MKQITVYDVLYSIGFSTLMLIMNYILLNYDKQILGITLSMINFMIGCSGSIALAVMVKHHKPKNINTT